MAKCSPLASAANAAVGSSCTFCHFPPTTTWTLALKLRCLYLLRSQRSHEPSRREQGCPAFSAELFLRCAFLIPRNCAQFELCLRNQLASICSHPLQVFHSPVYIRCKRVFLIALTQSLQTRVETGEVVLPPSGGFNAVNEAVGLRGWKRRVKTHAKVVKLLLSSFLPWKPFC